MPMKLYELLYIVPSHHTDAEAEEIAAGVATLLEKSGAKTLKRVNLGKIKLAYPIKKVSHGTYMLNFFEAEPSAIAAVDQTLRLHENVLRHLVTEPKAGAMEREVKIASYVAPLSEEARTERGERGERGERREREAAPKRQAAPAASPAPAAPAKPEASNLTMEELDKKLDAIIDEEVKVA